MPDMTQEAVRQEKQRLRREGIAKRRAMTPEAVRQGGEVITAKVLALPEVQRAALVLSYVEKPGSNEVPTTPILKALLSRGVAVAVPRVAGEALRWYRIESLDDLQPGTFGVPEPTTNSVIRHYPVDTYCLVPGMWWSKEGFRLGYGGGHFDRFLSEFGMVAIGLGWEWSHIGTLPTEPHDEAVEVVITDDAT